MDKLSVAVVGLNTQQSRRVESLYSDRLDLNCIDKDLSPPKIQAAAASSDFVIVMTKFTSHQAQTAVREHSGLKFCNGAETAVKQQLDALINGLSL